MCTIFLNCRNNLIGIAYAHLMEASLILTMELLAWHLLSVVVSQIEKVKFSVPMTNDLIK